jgi:hypothetical protein
VILRVRVTVTSVASGEGGPTIGTLQVDAGLAAQLVAQDEGAHDRSHDEGCPLDTDPACRSSLPFIRPQNVRNPLEPKL